MWSKLIWKSCRASHRLQICQNSIPLPEIKISTSAFIICRPHHDRPVLQSVWVVCGSEKISVFYATHHTLAFYYLWTSLCTDSDRFTTHRTDLCDNHLTEPFLRCLKVIAENDIVITVLICLIIKLLSHIIIEMFKKQHYYTGLCVF